MGDPGAHSFLYRARESPEICLVVWLLSFLRNGLARAELVAFPAPNAVALWAPREAVALWAPDLRTAIAGASVELDLAAAGTKKGAPLRGAPVCLNR